MTEETYPNSGMENSTNEQIYRITGKVIDGKSRLGIPGLRVEARDNNFFCDGLRGSAVTDANGIFLIITKKSDFSGIFGIFFEQCPDLYFKIYQNDELAYSTYNSTFWDVCNPEFDIVIELDLPSCDCGNPGESLLRVYGIVRNESGESSAGFLVKAFDVPDTLLGETLLDKNSRYQIDFSKAAYKNTAAGRDGPNLQVNVYDQNSVKIGQSRLVNNAGRVTELNVEVNTVRYRVYGTVLDGQGAPLRNHTVRAFDRDLRSEETLGNKQTDETGFYEIKYTPEQFQRSEKGLADLIVRVYDEHANEMISSKTIFNAKPETMVNLSLPGADPRGLPEFDNYVRELTPLLGSVPQYELTNPDIAFLAAETGIDPRHLLWLAESARRHLETPIIDQFVYYGLFRQNLPTALDELLAQELPILRDALEKSSQSHIIRLLSSDEIDAIIAKFHRLQADQATEPGGTETSSLGDLLRTVLTDAASIRAVAQLYITHNNRVSAEFFAGLTSLNLFSSQKLTDIRLALQLGELTGIYLPLVRELQSMANTDPLYAPTGDLSPYVRLTLEDWKGVLRRKQSNGEIIGAPSTVEGDDIEAKIVNYAISLSEQLEGAFPSTTIIRRIEADSGSNSPFKDTHADLMTFFATNPSFDLGRLPLDIYLATDTEAKLAGVENRETFIKTFKALQRVVRLTPNYEAIQMFMTDGLHSAQALTALGQHYFINQYSYYLGGEKKALSVYVTAQFIQNTAMAVYMKHSPTFQSPLPYVMGGQPISIRNESFKQDQAQVQALPDWTALFGSLALCECRHCRSLYSPAAYLVDILNFIKKVPSSSEGTTALDILLMQRPDIAHSELTCNNSNTPMPYVDLVNEILEAKVAPQELTLNWDEAIVMNLDQQIIDDSLLADFENNNYILTDKASVRVDSEGWNWTILDTSWAFVLTNDGDMSGSISATVWPQTSWSAKELKANPEHTHIGAYNKLRTAVYPWSLPFNLPIEEARVYLRHLAVRRYDLLNIFMREASLKQKYAVAYEYLGLTTEEAAIINGSTIGGWTATNPGPWDFWGLSEDDNDIPDPVDSSVDNAQGTWVEVLKRVSIFLQRSGLSYRELLNLLDTRYLNPRNVDSPNGCSFAIVAADGSNPMTCNASELALSAFEDDSLEYEEMFDRAHRFVRLARKLSWALHDLDKAITALKPEGFGGNFNKFLVQLSRIQQLSIEKNIPVVNLLSFWADIDYTPYVDHLTDGEPVIPSLYAQMFLSKTLAATKFPENPEDLIDQKISEHTAAIAAALGIGADDIDRLRTNPRVIPLIQDSADQTKYIQDDDLTLVNLSRLYRHALLARIVKLPIPQYLTTLELITPDPFHSTLATMNFISAADRIANAGFSVDDLDYLLRHTADSKSELAITDADIGAALDVIRADLGQIAAENTFVGAGSDDNVATTDPDGDLTRKKLALLNWSAVEINTVVAILNNTYLFDTRLDSLNLSIRFPVQLANRISYDATAHRLQFKGVMSSENKNQLLASPNDTDQPFKEAVEALYNAPRSFMKRQMRRFSVPVFESTKFSPLSNVLMPTPVKNKVFSVLYDETNGVKKQTLRCIGIMTEAEKKILYRLSNAKPYVDAITELYNKPETMPLQPLDKFLTVVQVDDLFDAPEPAQRFLLVLKKLMPYLLSTLSKGMVKQRLTEHTRLDSSTVEGLLNTWVHVPSSTPKLFAIATFVDPLFTGSNTGLQITRAAFPKQFKTYLLLHKIAAIIGKFAFKVDIVRILFERPARRWLDFNTLPLNPENTAYALFQAWSHLANIVSLRATLPHGELAVSSWLAAANATDVAPEKMPKTVIEALSLATQWNQSDLHSLAKGLNKLKLKALRKETTILRLANAMALQKRLRATAGQCLAWTQPETVDNRIYLRDIAQAQDIKQLVRAKYDPTQWLEVAGSLRNPLREKQRATLVDYLLTTPDLGNANELYEQLLIDVEMSPCMMTTRIKQAISSVQLYVQRMLMNLEESWLSPDQAKQWAMWRKQYRVWEANRKVLLYPENWIEPELRDNKTPFFKDLENELLQNDITTDIAEDAFINYLEKLNQVARLDIVGMYQEDIDYVNKVLHVIGRTVAVPHIYFYRRLENTVWTPWEKVELDIEGDHLIPVVWNRRLHLFWAIFTEKSEQPTKEQRANNEDPEKFWEIKLAWSEYKHKGWAPKKLSGNPLKVRMDLSKSGQQATMEFTFRTQIITTTPVGRSLSIECFGPFVYDPPTKTAPTNETHPSEINQDIDVDALTFHCQYLFKIDGKPADINARNKIQVWVLYFKDNNPHWQSYEVSENGTADILRGTSPSPLVGDIFRVFLRSAEYVIIEGSSKLTYNDKILKILEINLKLRPKSTPASVNVDPKVDKLKCLGEFRLDDCNDNLVVGFNGELGSIILPPLLKPLLTGTDIQGMEAVEASSSANALGKTKILSQTPGKPFRLLFEHNYMASMSNFFGGEIARPFFFKDENRTYFIDVQLTYFLWWGVGHGLRFSTFYHPYVCQFIRSLKQYGVDGMLTLANQQLTDLGASFDQYEPSSTLIIRDVRPLEDVDFRPEGEGSYSQYNWELFFHAPFMIATQLSKNQRFEEAQKWFHYIFNPTSPVSSYRIYVGAKRFWKVLPFAHEANRRVQTLDELLADSAKITRQAEASAAKPFNPHAIARLRIMAYMKAVVMHYIDNLLAWGDQLFGRDTIESINEATQLYILAAEMLGKRPESIPPRATAKVQTYNTLYNDHDPDSLSNALVEVEGYIFPSTATVSGDSPELAPIPYFCTSPNDKLLGYWDIVADRLFKIRHCMNLAGIERSLPIYEPPIDPALLVKAAAAGVDLSSALGDINAAAPHYRFGILLPKATELCNDVKSLGAALLSALEKRDAEALTLLRSSHEIDVLKSVRQIKDQQIKEASANLNGLNEFKNLVTAREQYYLSREFMNQFEQTHMDMTTAGQFLTLGHAGAETLAAILHLIPEATVGMSPGMTYGGHNIASAVQAFGGACGATVSFLNTAASMNATLGGYHRRSEDWTHQADLATQELKQVEKQIAAAEIRLAIAEHELENHDQQIENAQEVDAFMRSKFTNKELYNWMVGQLSAVYFQSYQLAYDVAKRAERGYRFELGLQNSNFIQFGYWDSLKKGLLSGERLHYDLKRMDVAYLDQNRREYEITKHISLATLDPMAIVKLKNEQSCFISLPEVLFDLDHPGHYLRRIKSVSMTIPCVTGPYVGVHCTLTLLNSSVRHSNMLFSSQYYERRPEDIRFTDSMGATQSIVTSSGQNDSGLFEANLRDERYLPFEGAGVISEWRLQLPSDFQQFDYGSISDVILHFRYTARDGGKALADKANDVIRTRLNTLRQLSETQTGLVQMLSLRQEYPTEWNQLRSGNDGTTHIVINKTNFPYLVSSQAISLIRFEAVVRVRPPESGQLGLGVFTLELTKGTGSVNLSFPAKYNLVDWRKNDSGGEVATLVTASDDEWTLKLLSDPLTSLDLQKRALLEDIVLLVGYQI